MKIKLIALIRPVVLRAAGRVTLAPMGVSLLSVAIIIPIRSDVSAMPDSDVGDQQMLITVLTNFQNFIDIPFISTCYIPGALKKVSR